MRQLIAGNEIEAAVSYPEDARQLIEREPIVRHHELARNVERCRRRSC